MATTTRSDRRVLVLRLPQQGENFQYRVADVPGEEARRWEARLTQGAAQLAEIGAPFGDVLTLPEVMDCLDSRDFQVLDVPAR